MSALSPPQGRLERLAEQLDNLGQAVLKLWLAHGISAGGGAHGFLDRRWNPVIDPEAAPGGPSGEVRGDQSLVQQARHLFSYALFEQTRPGDPRVRSAAAHLLSHFEEHFWQGEARPCLHQVDIHGNARDAAVQLYAQAFAVYGLATYGQAFKDARVGAMARSLFFTVDELRHDGAFGGYDQRDDGGWLPYVGAPTNAAKCTNTHIHVLEALTPLVRLFPEDDQLRVRLSELMCLISNRLLQAEGYVHKHFGLDWAPVGAAEVSYGHDLETSWLLLEALDALLATGAVEEGVASQVRAGARLMAEHALRTGWDSLGGVFDSGIPEGQDEAPRVVCHEKVWWAQAEALPGIYSLFRQTPCIELVEKMESTLAFMLRYSWDQDFGEFYWGVLSDGTVCDRGDHKGEIWKTPYHALRACLITADWIRVDQRKAQGSP